MIDAKLLIPFFIALGITVICIPFIIRFSRRMGWFDEVDHRKIHEGDVSRLGGVAIFLGFLAGSIAFLFFPHPSITADLLFKMTVFLSAAFVIHFAGLYDDFKTLRPRDKFIIQVLAAVAATAAGLRFRGLTIVFTNTVLDFPLISWIITLIWIVGVCNAINLIDGMDGLSSTISFIAAMTMGIIALLLGKVVTAAAAFSLAGALLGFFLFNKPPALLFMGDSGSLFTGIVLAVLPLLETAREEPLSLTFSITILLIPVTDTLFAITRRIARKKAISTPDREHLHHTLMDLGFSPRAILLMLGAYGLILASLPVLTILTGQTWTILFMPVLWGFTFFLFYWLHRLVRKKTAAN